MGYLWGLLVPLLVCYISRSPVKLTFIDFMVGLAYQGKTGRIYGQ